MGDDNGGATERTRSAAKKQRQATMRLAGVLLFTVVALAMSRYVRRRGRYV
jgi:hypothetical protein